MGETCKPMYIVQTPGLTSDPPTVDIPAEIQQRYPMWAKRILDTQLFDLTDWNAAQIDNPIEKIKSQLPDQLDRLDRMSLSQTGWDYPAFNPNFVGRRHELLELHKKLLGVERTVRGAAAVHGFGGFGKSELAIAYGHAAGQRGHPEEFGR